MASPKLANLGADFTCLAPLNSISNGIVSTNKLNISQNSMVAYEAKFKLRRYKSTYGAVIGNLERFNGSYVGVCFTPQETLLTISSGNGVGTHTTTHHSYNFQLDTWYTLKAVYDGTILKVFVNGEIVVEAPRQIIHDNTYLVVGKWANFFGEYLFNGVIQYTKMEVNNSPYIHYELTRGFEGATVVDRVGNNNGVIQNGVRMLGKRAKAKKIAKRYTNPLNPTQQVNRPARTVQVPYSLKADFVGKIAGSTKENPHSFYARTSVSTASPPFDVGNTVVEPADVGLISTLNGAMRANVASNANYFAQQYFSFNVVEMIERELGEKAWRADETLANKVAIAKQIIKSINCDWYGYGNSVGGNKATFKRWASQSNIWFGTTNHGNSVPTKIAIGTVNMSEITANGFMHFLANSEPSDGVVSSAIFTDYVELRLSVEIPTVQKRLAIRK